jgi:Coenzyme PQQ synthesis protein D (PqqD)
MNNGTNGTLRTSEMKPNANVLFKRLGDEMVLFHLDTDHFYELNGTAARFWELLHEAPDVETARERMLGEFAVDPDKLAGEVDAFLASLRKENLVSLDE